MAWPGSGPLLCLYLSCWDHPSYPPPPHPLAHRSKQSPGSGRQGPTLASSGGLPVAAGLSCGTPALRPPGRIWGPGPAGSGRGGGRASGAGAGGCLAGTALFLCTSERLRQGDACEPESCELASGNDASLQSLLPKNACIYHEGPSGGVLGAAGARMRGGSWHGPTAQMRTRSPQACGISQVPPRHPCALVSCLSPGGRVGLLVVFSAPCCAVLCRVPPAVRGGNGGWGPAPGAC